MATQVIVSNNHNSTAGDEPPLLADVSSVQNAIQACTSPDPSIRRPAEELLQKWERSPHPGYLSSLFTVLTTTADHDLRLFAAILLKNSIPHVWNWSMQDNDENDDQSPTEQALRSARCSERAAARSTLPSILFQEPSDRIALHLGLALANVGLFDFPNQWPTLLQDLVAASGGCSSSTPTVRVRAIRATRDVLQAVRHCKLVVKQQKGGVRTLVELQNLMSRAAEGRRKVHNQAAAVASPLMTGAIGHARALLNTGVNWELEGTLCIGYMKSMAELFPMMVDSNSASRQQDTFAFLEQAVMIVEETKVYNRPCPVVGANAEAWTRLLDKVHRATLQCCIMAMTCIPDSFAPHVARFLEIVVGTMLGIDNVQALPVKRVVTYIRLVKTVLTCRLYDPYPEARVDTSMVATLMGQKPPQNTANPTKDDTNPNVKNARNAVAGLLGEGLCEQMVQVLVTKFIRLSEEEVAEWDLDPEGRFETDQAERTMPEPETPRLCGGILLSVMMNREESRVSQALLNLTKQICQCPPDDVVGLLNREACYRALEICRPLMQKDWFNFLEWWDAEIATVLQSSLGPQHPVPMRALQARAVEVLQVCSASIRESDFPLAFQAVSRLLVAPDLVTALYAARCLYHLALFRSGGQEETPQLKAVKEHSVPALGNAFALANRVTSEECLRTTLLLVSGLVEANGTSLEPCLHAIAEQLPPLWERAGDSVPIHSCLIAVLNHLIMKIGYKAVENAHVQKVLFPLVDYCTSIREPNRAETLLEDGLKLWVVTLLTSRMTTMGPSLTSMLPRLEEVLRSGLEPHFSLQVLQYYAVLMGSQVVERLADVLRTLLIDCTACVDAPSKDDDMDKMEEDETKEYKTDKKVGTVKDCVAALNFADAMLQLFPQLGYSICYPSLSKVLTALPGRRASVSLLEGAFGTLARLLWFRPSVLEEMFADDENKDKNIISIVGAWLRVVSGSSIMLMLSPSLRTMKFIDQKAASLSLCAAVCQSSHLARLVGQPVVEFTEALQGVESTSELDVDALVEASCGTSRKAVGDGPLGDTASRTAEMLKADPLLTVSLKDALEKASKAVKISS